MTVKSQVYDSDKGHHKSLFETCSEKQITMGFMFNRNGKELQNIFLKKIIQYPHQEITQSI